MKTLRKTRRKATKGSAEFRLCRRPTSDEAIRAAAKVAIDAGHTRRARWLLDLLDAKPKAAPVLMLATRKAPR